MKWDHPELALVSGMSIRGVAHLYPPKVSAVSGKPHAFRKEGQPIQFDKLSYWVVWGDGYRGHREAREVK